MRYLCGFLCVCALGVMPLVGCLDATGAGGSGGAAGDGGSGGNGVACVDNVCPCSEAGIRAAIAEGGGPFTFDCPGPTNVATGALLLFDRDVVLDGKGNLTVDGVDSHAVIEVAQGVTVGLRALTVTGGRVGEGTSASAAAGITNRGALQLSRVSVQGNTCTGPSCIAGGISSPGNDGITISDSAITGNTGMALLSSNARKMTVST